MSTWNVFPGFVQPVRDAQQAFRQILQAFAEPATVHRLDMAEPLQALDAASHACALALLDAETPVWLGAGLDQAVIGQHLLFHCGCPLASSPSLARFAFLDAAALEDLDRLDNGTDRDPDLSCTVFIQVPALEVGQACLWSGPGMAGERTVRLPLDAAFWARRNAMSQFPRGLDIGFVCGTQLLALPRSTRVRFPLED